ncbi:hypothetical protein DFP93_10694 [Aneurinibacillus soli]|uniref:Uncharacterized protein n=2 Tax=Aneurinibacillus soli TaxID=1500254 RepID=A0A0U5B165_9BACL|nr:hypothetical protein DFP93_10694 [Aneurinibacillus soli]BAU29717.1 hypothetical protein CB4_03954 [Aneurinibacillus soli]
MSSEQKWYILDAYNDFDMEKDVRYRLFRRWDSTKPKVGVIMFNPKQVNPNPFVLGQTLGKITKLLVDQHQHGSIEVVNLFAKTSDSKKLFPREYKKFDSENFEYIQKVVEESEKVVLFWGNGGSVVSKNPRFIELLKKHNHKLWCFGITNKSQPKYVRTLGDSNELISCKVDNNGNICVI